MPSAAYDSIPKTGHGWTAQDVYVGVSTENDTQAYAKGLGVAYNPGNIEADVQAVITAVNAHGGLFGRKLVAIYHDNSAAEQVSDPSELAQANCAAFTEDNAVVGVVEGIPLPATLATCLAQHGTPMIDITSDIYEDSAYTQYPNYLYTTLVPSLNTLLPVWVTHLVDQGYFSGWNTTTGKPSNAKAKVGLFLTDDANGQETASLLTRLLTQAGQQVVKTYYYSGYGESDGNAATLAFASAGVTHVLSVPPIAASLVLLMESAQSQRYHPRYGVTSYNFLESVGPDAPASQLAGTVGMGWSPTTDVLTAQDPGDVGPGETACRGDLAKESVAYEGDSGRAALRAAYTICDGFSLLAQGFLAGGGLTPADLHAGLTSAGSKLALAAVFPPGGLSATNYGVPGEARYIRYESGCSCFAYYGAPFGM